MNLFTHILLRLKKTRGTVSKLEFIVKTVTDMTIVGIRQGVSYYTQCTLGRSLADISPS